MIVAVVRVMRSLVADAGRRRDGLRAVLEVRQRPELGMRLDPAIDEQLDDLRCGAASRSGRRGRGATRGTEMSLGFSGLPRAGPIDLGLDGRVAGLDALRVGDRATSTSSTLTRCSAGSRYSSRSWSMVVSTAWR